MKKIRHQRVGVTIADTVWPPIYHLLPFFSSVVNFSHRRTLKMKNVFKRKMFGPSKNLEIDPFPNSVGHFETQWRPSWISHVSNTGFAPSIWQLSYRGGANLKIMIFVFDMLVIMRMDLGNCKNRLGGSKADKLRRAYWETTFGIVQNCQEFDKYLL